MILVDSSVWIDYFRGVAAPQSDRLDSLLGVEPLAMGDLVLAEVLQGFSSERESSGAVETGFGASIDEPHSTIRTGLPVAHDRKDCDHLEFSDHFRRQPKKRSLRPWVTLDRC